MFPSRLAELQQMVQSAFDEMELKLATVAQKPDPAQVCRGRRDKPNPGT